MYQPASFEICSTHPLAGLESWPTTGPVYGFAEDERPLRSRTLWERIGDRLRKAPDEAPAQQPFSRVWY